MYTQIKISNHIVIAYILLYTFDLYKQTISSCPSRKGLFAQWDGVPHIHNPFQLLATIFVKYAG